MVETKFDMDDLNNEQELGNNQDVQLSKEIYSKHPLQNTWALWFYKNEKSKSWEANQRVVTTFETVEDFWAIYNHIQLASKLTLGCDYALFKEGIKPMWEDARNRMGGRWLVSLNRNQRTTDLDRLWLETLLCLIGEAFGDDSDQVCGAVVNIRIKGDKLAMWTSLAENVDSVLKIGRCYKERLTLSQKYLITYEQHIDTATKTGSQSKNKFTL
ncbi:eukaryotic translation initiation factor 4E-1A isoform X2 [Hydra vulgaris]|uniref:Eukaryotic translation initiation factor 4E-1A isoform X2 n=1 Tax=Hydra vulgaris TaxID=6087 RepID=A0ABM4BXW3_HYDVU